MRVPISSVIASLVVTLTTPSPPAFAQQDDAVSTIRLTSVGEPARDSSADDSNTQLDQPATEQRQVAPPIQQLDAPANQPNQSFAPPIVRASVATTANNRTRMPAGLYAGPATRSTPIQPPGPSPVQSAPRAQLTRRGGKPFQVVNTQPAISPYLYLNAGANASNSITNYYAFVRPQQEQVESGRQQQREIQQLKSQMQKMSSTGAGSQSANSNSAAHYMDTAQFYRGLQRQ